MPITLKCLKSKEPALEPETLGEHVKRSRLEREISRREAALLLGVTPWTVFNWEKGRTDPAIEAMPAIIRFLGYDPSPAPRSLPERLLAKRRAMGWSIQNAAKTVAVDPGVWSDWERGGVILFRANRRQVARLLDLSVKEVDREMRSRWSDSHRRAK